MIKRLDCVCIATKDVAASVLFYVSLGLTEGWRIERTTEDGRPWTLVGLKFPDATSSELVLSDNPDITFTEIELQVDDVQATREQFGSIPGIEWIREPFAIESGHVAVMKAPDGNLFVLVGG